MSDKPKFCKNCKHYSTPFMSLIPRCSAKIEFGPVSGRKMFGFCHIERDGDVPGWCGTSAQWFEPRPLRWWEFWK